MTTGDPGFTQEFLSKLASPWATATLMCAQLLLTPPCMSELC